MSSPLQLLGRAVRQPLRQWVRTAFPRDQAGAIDYEHPSGDPGLFGPGSVIWKIHADFAGMLSGGLSALILQTLHPAALAGVYDHSNFREDLVGRLRRTTAFVGATTYAPRHAAQRMIERVRAIHTQVRGVTPDGQAYAADDPALLTWVHVTEVYSFLRGYRRYCRHDLPATAIDRYFDESRRIAEALGATDVPASMAEIEAYLQRVRPQLRFDARSREVLDILTRIRLPVPLAGPSRGLFLGAAVALLPDWALDLLDHPAMSPPRARLSGHALQQVAPWFRSALTDGVASKACRRMGVPAEILQQWPV
ncbi:oxygenase MpaB family protein [Frateuria aurantia]